MGQVSAGVYPPWDLISLSGNEFFTFLGLHGLWQPGKRESKKGLHQAAPVTQESKNKSHRIAGNARIENKLSTHGQSGNR